MINNLFLGGGEEVRDRADSHVATHESVHGLLPEALKKIYANGRRFIIEEVEMGRIVGESICVPTSSGDQIMYEQRPNRSGLTRFVLNRKPEPSSTVVVILEKIEGDNFFTLLTSYVGRIAPPETWDEVSFAKTPDPDRARIEAKIFWENHALVWGYEKKSSSPKVEEEDYVGCECGYCCPRNTWPSLICPYCGGRLY